MGSHFQSSNEGSKSMPFFLLSRGFVGSSGLKEFRLWLSVSKATGSLELARSHRLVLYQNLIDVVGILIPLLEETDRTPKNNKVGRPFQTDEACLPFKEFAISRFPIGNDGAFPTPRALEKIIAKEQIGRSHLFDGESLF